MRTSWTRCLICGGCYPATICTTPRGATSLTYYQPPNTVKRPERGQRRLGLFSTDPCGRPLYLWLQVGRSLYRKSTLNEMSRIFLSKQLGPSIISLRGHINTEFREWRLFKFLGCYVIGRYGVVLNSATSPRGYPLFVFGF